MLPVLIRLLTCFAIGSIPFAVLAMAGSGIDIRSVGSGNPGFNNVLRVSKSRAVVALIGDMGKGYLAVWLVLRFWPPQLSPSGGHALATNPVGTLGTVGTLGALGWLCGFAAVLGHCYSPLLKFNGGKGVATSAGVMLVLYPAWAVAAMIYFATFRVTAGKLKWREAGALASLTTWLVFAILMLLFVGRRDALYAACMTLFLLWRHQKNVRNLLAAACQESKSPR